MKIQSAKWSLTNNGTCGQLIKKKSNIIKDSGTGKPGHVLDHNDFCLNKPGFHLRYFLEGCPGINSFRLPCTHLKLKL